jgi:hypothetical protein
MTFAIKFKNGWNLYSYPFLQAEMPLLQFLFSGHHQMERRIRAGFAEGD